MLLSALKPPLLLGDDPRLTVTAMQTVGVKGWDGFTLAWINAI